MRNFIIIFFLSFVFGLEAQTTIVDNVDRSMVGNVDNHVNSSEIYDGKRHLFFGIYIMIDYVKNEIFFDKEVFHIINFKSIPLGEVLTLSNGGKLTIKYSRETFKPIMLFRESFNVQGLKAEYIGSH